jgi:3-oxoacyl-[acyl-carrier-protein] synthase III
MDGLQRGSAAIVGIAESDLGAVAKEMSPIDLMAQGIQRALADCGLHLRDVDGLICATTQSRTSGLALSEYLGISPAFIDTTILGGSSFMFHVAHAQAALQLGLCKVAVIAYGSTQRTVGRRQASVREYNPYETPFRPFLPATAMRWRRRATCTNTAPPASNWRRSRWRRGNGHCSTRRRGKRSR